MEEAAAYLEETGVGLGEYLELVRGRARELFGLDQPPPDEHGDQQAERRRRRDIHRGSSTGGDGKVDTTWALVWHLVVRLVSSCGVLGARQACVPAKSG